MAVFKKYRNRNQTSARTPCNAARPSRHPKCFNCGSVGHTVSNCPKPEVSKVERPCFECGKQGHLARDCTSKPQSSTVVPRKPFAKRPPARANNLENMVDQIALMVEKVNALLAHPVVVVVVVVVLIIVLRVKKT